MQISSLDIFRTQIYFFFDSKRQVRQARSIFRNPGSGSSFKLVIPCLNSTAQIFTTELIKKSSNIQCASPFYDGCPISSNPDYEGGPRR